MPRLWQIVVKIVMRSLALDLGDGSPQMLTIWRPSKNHESLTENLIKETNFGELHLLKLTLISGRVLDYIYSDIVGGPLRLCFTLNF